MMVSQNITQAIAAHSALNCPNSLPGNVRFTTMLTDDQKLFFATNGYVLVKGLLSPSEASTYREECHALATRLADIRGIEDPTWDGAHTEVPLICNTGRNQPLKKISNAKEKLI